jgi:hypothetical protein
MGCDRFVECGSLLPLSKAAASRRSSKMCPCSRFLLPFSPRNACSSHSPATCRLRNRLAPLKAMPFCLVVEQYCVIIIKMKVLFLFIDGVGLREPATTIRAMRGSVRPSASSLKSTRLRLTPVSTPRDCAERHWQTAMFTGVNASQV